MSLLDRQAREIPYDDSEPVLRQDPDDPNHFTYASPAIPLLQVKVERGQRGGYGWTISYSGLATAQVLAMIRQTDLALRAEYGRSTNATLRGEYGAER